MGLHVIDFTVDGIGLNQVVVSTNRIDLTIIHDHDPVCILDRRDPLTNDDLGRVFKTGSQSLTDQAIGLSIDSRGRIIQDQNLWIHQESAGDTETLTLTT